MWTKCETFVACILGRTIRTEHRRAAEGIADPRVILTKENIERSHLNSFLILFYEAIIKN